jgi:Ankyrin repeats (many copies)
VRKETLSMATSRYVGIVGLLATLTVTAAQGQTANILADAGTPESAIDNIPLMARAVLSRDLKRVTQAIQEGQSVNEPIRLKGGRAGFTPLILAAIISDPDIAAKLIENGADITKVDNFNRSAFWYAALREDVKVINALVNAPSAKEAINKADSDFCVLLFI